MKLWCKKSFDWSGFLIFPPISETFWGCITMHLQFRRQADLALSSDFFSNKTTGVNSWENNGPRSESGRKKKKPLLPGHFIWWGGESYPPTTDIYSTFAPRKIQDNRVFKIHTSLLSWVKRKYNSSLHYICTLLCLNPIMIIAPLHPKQPGKTTFHFIPFCLPFIF